MTQGTVCRCLLLWCGKVTISGLFGVCGSFVHWLLALAW
jgi:hypothetical protein